MKIVVIDGQSGRLGAQLIEALASRLPMDQHQLIAIGANSLATSAMLKAGAQQGATGENPVLVACRDADIIAGPIGIVIADALLGEITPSMAAAVHGTGARVSLPGRRESNTASTAKSSKAIARQAANAKRRWRRTALMQPNRLAIVPVSSTVHIKPA